MADTKALRIDRTTTPKVTMLALDGTVDASFEGKAIAASVKTDKLVISLRDVRRFASWGMAEWVNMLRGVAECELYFVECSTYALHQMKLVTGLLGHGKIVSLYTPFRCASCGEEVDTLVVLSGDPSQLDQVAESVRTCATCGKTARMGKLTGEVISAISSRSSYDIDEDVAQFLRTRFKYEIAPNLTRFRALSRKAGKYTYVRLLGNLATLPSEQLARHSEKITVVDLGGVVADVAQLDAWRTYLKAASANVDEIQLLDCPIGFIYDGVTATDLEGKIKIRSFIEPCTCPACNVTTPRIIDVASNLEELTAGMVPGTRCSSCGHQIRAQNSAAILPRFPARERDIELDRFLEKARVEPEDKLANALARVRAKPVKQGSVTRSVFLGSALAAVVVGGLAIGIVTLGKQDDPNTILSPSQNDPAPPPRPTFQRPDWITSDTPSSGFCQEVVGRLVCVGVSSLSSNRDAAVIDANDAAIDELVNSIALKIEEPWFRTNVLAGYASRRTKLLSAAGERGADDASVRKARHRVVELLQASGGPAVPAQRSDWYWEEYEKPNGEATEFLVFVRYDVTIDALKLLVERYSTQTSIKQGSVVTAFPGLAWLHPEFPGGVMLTKVGRPFSDESVDPYNVVTSVNEQPVGDADELVKQLAQSNDKTPAQLAVQTLDGTAKTVPYKP